MEASLTEITRGNGLYRAKLLFDKWVVHAFRPYW